MKCGCTGLNSVPWKFSSAQNQCVRPDLVTGLRQCGQVKWGLTAMPRPQTKWSVSTQRRETWTDARGHMNLQAEIRVCATPPEKPRTAGYHQKLGQMPGRVSPSAFRGSRALPTPPFWLLASKSMTEETSIVLSYPVYGELLHEP